MGCRAAGAIAAGLYTGVSSSGYTMWLVLIVEDDPQMRDFFGASIKRSGDLALAGSDHGLITSATNTTST